MAELLFEIGCEELPASMIDQAQAQCGQEIAKRLNEAGITFETLLTAGTPRRLVVSMTGLPDVQPDQNKEIRGPAIKAAFDAEGSPTKALEGFCRSQNVTPADIERDGDYVWIRRTEKGQPVSALMRTILPDAIGALQFRKSMRWADSKARFARPIRWILAILDGKVIDLTFEGITSSNESRGHRFMSPQNFAVSSFQDYHSELLKRFVLLTKEDRIKRIEASIRDCSSGALATTDLVAENANLTEWPEAHEGTFKPEFLELPRPVLTTVMAKHERFFPVAEGEQLTNKFVAVRNGGEEKTVREGNAWVLNARFNDARFFFEEDKKKTLDSFLERTSQMTFQEKIGTVRHRADRLANLAHFTALWSGANDEEAVWARQAGLYSKADLTTGLVSELDELQGMIGGEYAKREGFPEAVCSAIAAHYDLSSKRHVTTAGDRTTLRLLIADQADKLVGFVGTGFVPTGSSDPFGLRRSATALIEACWSWPTTLSGLTSVLEKSFTSYSDQGFELDQTAAWTAISEIFRSRYEALLEGRYDIVQSALLPGDHLLDPRAVRTRLLAMQQLSRDSSAVQAATRPANILAAAAKSGVAVPEDMSGNSNFDSKEADELFQVLQRQAPLAQHCAQAEDAVGLATALEPLFPAINTFFETTMVMVDNQQTREARLSLLWQCDSLLRLAGDFSKVVIEG